MNEKIEVIWSPIGFPPEIVKNIENASDKELNLFVANGLSKTCAIHNLATGIIGDATEIASDNILEQRVSSLETPPEVTKEQLFMDFLVTYLFGKAAGTLLSKTTSRNYTHMVQTRRLLMSKQISSTTMQQITSSRIKAENFLVKTSTEFQNHEGLDLG